MTLRCRRLARLFSLAVFLALVPFAGAQAASFGISPVRVELTPSVPTAALTLRNGADEPALVQVRAVAWSQRDGEDVYEPTNDVIVSPPIFTLAGNGAQVVRVGLRRAPDAERELSYRIFLQEVQGPPKPGAVGLQMALRIGLPVFVKPVAAAQPRLEWRARRDAASGALRVSAVNAGNLHVQVIDFRLLAGSGDGSVVATQAASAYLLPGQRREWRVEPQQPLTAATLRVQAITDAGELSADVALDAP